MSRPPRARVGALAAFFPPETAKPATELDWVLAAPWTTLGLVIGLAAVVLLLNALARRRGRTGSGPRRRPDFDLDVARMESLPLSRVADARTGPVRLEATLVSAEETLGGAPGRACVWRNRYGGARKSAIGSSLVIAADESGHVALENLEQARVIAPREEQGHRHEVASLYLRDRVELLGYFTSARPAGADAAHIHGRLGTEGQIQVRLLARPVEEASSAVQAAVLSDDPAGTPVAPGGGTP